MNTPKYKNGVSNAAIITLNKNPANSKPLNKLQSISPKKQSKSNTVAVSTNCDRNVEQLLRNQRCFPLVIRFQ